MDVLARDYVLEILAHKYAYEDFELSAEHVEDLKKMGFAALEQIKDDTSGFSMTVFEPVKTDKKIFDENVPKNYVIAFRGSNSPVELTIHGLKIIQDGVQDWLSNLDAHPRNPGESQYIKNVTEIRKVINRIQGPVTVIGHSLGGALAQISAAHFPDKIKEVVTFQAPGVRKMKVDRIIEYNKSSNGNQSQVIARHHRPSEGIVVRVGEVFLPGQIYIYDTTNKESDYSTLIKGIKVHFWFLLAEYFKGKINLEIVQNFKQTSEYRPLENIRGNLFPYLGTSLITANVVLLMKSFEIDKLIRIEILSNKRFASQMSLTVRLFFLEMLCGFHALGVFNISISEGDLEVIKILIKSTPFSSTPALLQRFKQDYDLRRHIKVSNRININNCVDEKRESYNQIKSQTSPIPN